MKFGETLRTNLVPEWELYYINYAKLKLILKSYKKRKEGVLSEFLETISLKDFELGDQDDLVSQIEEDPQMFYNLLVYEVEKVESFYIQKLGEVKEDIDALGHQIESLAALEESKKKDISRGMIMKAAIQCYRVVMMLDNFCNLNGVAIKKIVKKHDKVTGEKMASTWMAEVQQRVFFTHQDLDRLKRVVEVFYAKYFCDGNKYNATNRLKQRLHQDTNWLLLKIGLQLGITIAFFLLLPFAIQGNSHNQYYDHTWSWESFIAIQPVFRLVLLPLIAIYMWALNVVVFRHYRINWVYICEFHPLNSANAETLLDIATCISAFFSVALVLYILQEIHSIYMGVPSIMWPLFLTVAVFIWVLFPFDFMYRGSRWTFIQILLSVFMSPMGLVRYIDFFVGDILTSMVKTLFDFEYTFCYYVTGDWLIGSPTRCNDVNAVALPVLSGLPLYWRLMQCLRRYRDTGMKTQLLNALKYLISLSVVLFSTLNGNLQGEHGWDTLRLAWLGSFIFATLYSYCWDVKMDWGLIEPDSKYPLLRNNTMLPIPFYYYAIVSNFFLRFFWAITISPLPPAIGINPNLLTLIAAILEVFRRFTWSIIRFENEYVNNVGKFRKTDWVPLPFDVNKPKRVDKILHKKENTLTPAFESHRGSLGGIVLPSTSGSSLNLQGDGTKGAHPTYAMGSASHLMPPSSSGSEKQPWVSERDDGVVTEESEDEVLVTMRRGGGGGTLRKRKAGSFLALGGHDLHAEAQSDIDLFIEPKSSVIHDILTDSEVTHPTKMKHTDWYN